MSRVKHLFAVVLAALMLCLLMPVAAFAEEASDGKMIVYAKLPSDWSDPHLWAWADDGTNAFDAWPGGEMEADSNNDGWYYCWIPETTNNIIINANDAAVQTSDYKLEKGIALFTYQGIYPGYLESMLWPALASATGIDNMKAIASYTPGSLSSDEALKVFQNMAKIGTDGYLMDGTVALNHTQSQTDMMMNKALFIPNGNWMEGEMADAPRADGFEFGLTCAPVLDDGETRYVMSSVEQFEIPANAKNPELAKEFLRFLYTEDSVKLFAERANGIYALKKANEMVKGIVTDGVYNMNDIYQEGTFMVFGWDAMPDTSKVVIADSVFNVASDVMNGDMTAEQWRDGIEAAFEEIAASK